MTDEVHSSLRLAEALEADFPYLAARARRHEFHDFLSPHAVPQTVLIGELGEHRKQVSAAKMVERVKRGEFDASKAEADEWAATPEGQAAMQAMGASAHAPETGLVDENHSLLVGHVLGALMRLAADSGSPTEVAPIEAGPRVYTNKISVKRKSGEYLVTVEPLEEDPDHPGQSRVKP